MKTKIILLILIIVIPQSFSISQISKRNEEIISKVNNALQNQLSIQYQVENFVIVDNELGLVIPESEFTQHGINDPYNTLKKHILFSAVPLDSNDNNIIGIYKDNLIVWSSEPVMNGLISDFIITEDLNLDGNVEMVITWDNAGTDEVWIFSWNGITGTCLNQKNDDGEYIPINIKSSDFSIADINGDGILEVRSREYLDGSLMWAWDGTQYTRSSDLQPLSFYSFLSAKNAKVKVNAFVQLLDDKLLYKYSVKNKATSKRKIEEFYIDSNAPGVTGMAPEGWQFMDQSEFSLQGWFWKSGNTNDMIAPDQMINGFVIQAGTAIPVIEKYYVQTQRESPILEDDPNPLQAVLFDIKNNSIVGYTIVPATIKDFLPIQFLATLHSYTSRSLDLNWIKEESVANKYANYFTTAKTGLEENNITAVHKTLSSVLRDVETDSGSVLTSEAYALLRYNTEYLLENLPEDPDTTK